MLAIAAAITTGAALPESKKAAEPMSVIFQTAEDGLGILPNYSDGIVFCVLSPNIQGNNLIFFDK